jgi:hypothetical protein
VIALCCERGQSRCKARESARGGRELRKGKVGKGAGTKGTADRSLKQREKQADIQEREEEEKK